MAKLAAQPVPPAADDIEFFYDIEQRSEEWYRTRLGIPTASRFADVLAGGEGKTRTQYMRELAGEIITGEPAESYQSAAMKRGVEMEPAIRDWYERSNLADLTPVGFVRRTVHEPLGLTYAVGCSPDSQVGTYKGLEIKTLRPDLLIAMLERGAAGFPAEHRAQLQGTMWVCGWTEMDLICGYGNMPKIKFTVLRDETYIATLKREAARFSYELAQMVGRVRGHMR